MRQNRMKRRIEAGEPMFGVSVMFPSPEVVEMIGELGFDWVLLDGEHGSISPTTLGPLVMAAEARGITPIVRPAENNAALIGRYLDQGAMGIQVPHVNTKKEAEAAVSAARYYPEGTRGLAGGRMADFGFGSSTREYVEEANGNILVCVQIEDVAAVDNLDEILTVDGVDVFFIGPTDLAQSMGHPGDNKHPDVQRVVAETLERIHAAEKASGTPGAAEEAAKNAAAGVVYHYTHVPTLMHAYAAHFMKTVGRS